ncbi:MAG: phytanoyl-CoA dioxygenase family protein [Chloroflexota bacterium]
MNLKRNQLVTEGYCIFENVLSADLLHRLRAVSNKVLDENDYASKKSNQGNIVTMEFQYSAFLDLITWPGAIDALQQLGFARPKYWTGFVIAKEPHEPPLYWHQDWVFWDEPEAADPLPHQLFLMYYLTDTRVENGCLRVIPRSHTQRFDLHDQLGTGHDSEIRATTDYTHPLMSEHPDEVDVPIKAGDLLIGDARILHSANRNQTDQRRTVLTLWYLPRLHEASERLQAGFRKNLFISPLDKVSEDDLTRLQPLLFEDNDNEEQPAWNRVPGKILK